MKINFFLNGKETQIECSPLKDLLSILRENFNLTGTKCGCKKGECNSCLVFFNEKLVNSCLIPAFRLMGNRITTIEGFTQSKEYQTIEKSFLKLNIGSCGFCVPSLVLATEALLGNKPHPTRKDIIENILPFLCLCSGYQQIVTAIQYISELRSKKKIEKKS
jgi:carbon-monoxide dehydrogenase small subunit